MVAVSAGGTHAANGIGVLHPLRLVPDQTADVPLVMRRKSSCPSDRAGSPASRRRSFIRFVSTTSYTNRLHPGPLPSFPVVRQGCDISALLQKWGAAIRPELVEIRGKPRRRDRGSFGGHTRVTAQDCERGEGPGASATSWL